MNKWVLMMVGFAFVMAVGVGTILVSKKSDEEVAADTAMFAAMKLTQHGKQICKQEIKKALGKSIFSPDTSSGNRTTTVTFTWDGKKKKKDFDSVTCTYNIDKGVEKLVIDGKTIIDK